MNIQEYAKCARRTRDDAVHTACSISSTLRWASMFLWSWFLSTVNNLHRLHSYETILTAGACAMIWNKQILKVYFKFMYLLRKSQCAQKTPCAGQSSLLEGEIRSLLVSVPHMSNIVSMFHTCVFFCDMASGCSLLKRMPFDPILRDIFNMDLGLNRIGF